MKKIAALALALAVSPAAFAGAEAGDSEVAIFGNITSTDTTDTYAVFGSYGYYFTDAILVNFQFGYAGASGSEVTLFGVGAEYNFGGEDMVPYVFAGIQGISGTGFSETGYSAGVGLKFYVSENAGYRMSVQMDSYDSYDDTQLNLGLFFNF
jgi:hypothetical protein